MNTLAVGWTRWLVLAALFVAACSSSGGSALQAPLGTPGAEAGPGATVPATPGAASTGTAGSDSSRQLLVAGGEDASTLQLVDVDTGRVETFETPPDLVGGPTINAAVPGPSSDIVLVSTAQDIYFVDVQTGVSTHPARGARLLRAVPRHGPEAVLLEAEGRNLVVDLRTGEVYDVGEATTSPGLSGRTGSRSVVVTFNAGGGAVIDLEANTVLEVPERLFLVTPALSPDGELVAAVERRGASRMQATVVFPIGDISAASDWHVADPDAQLRDRVWVGRTIVGLDFQNRLLELDGGALRELSRLEGEPPRLARIHGGLTAQHALLEIGADEDARWFRLDPSDGALESLPALDGMEQPVGDRFEDALILADGSGAEELSRVVVAPVGDGPVSPVFAAGRRETVLVSAATPDLIQAVTFEGLTRTHRFVEAADGREVGRFETRGRVVLSPDGSRIAVTPDPLIGEILVGPLSGDLQPLDVQGIGLAWL